MKEAVDIIADAIRPGMAEPKRALEAANAAIGMLTANGFSIVRRRLAGGLTVDRGPPPRPLMTNAIAGEDRQRGVFAEAKSE